MQIGVSYGSIQQLQENCTDTATKITQLVESLNSELSHLASSWTGNAYEAYKTDQSKWTQGSDDLSHLLHQIAQSLETTNQNYRSVENTNTGIFN